MEWLKNQEWWKLLIIVCALAYLSNFVTNQLQEFSQVKAKHEQVNSTDWQYIAEQQEEHIQELEERNATLEAALAASVLEPKQNKSVKPSKIDTLIWKYQKKYGSQRR